MILLKKSENHVYNRLKTHLKKQIEDRILRPGDPILPEAELCKRYKIGRNSVRQAIGQLVKEGLLKRVQGKGTFVKITRINIKGKTVGLILCNREFLDPYWARVLKGVEEEAKAKKLHMTYGSLNANVTTVKLGLPLTIKSNNLVGLILAGLKPPNIIDMVKKLKIPFVLVGDIACKEIVENGLDIIADDDVNCAYQAVRHLLDLGHTKIGFIGGPFTYSWPLSHLNGYIKAYRERSIEIINDYIVESKVNEFEEGFQVMKKLLSFSNPPTAIYAIEDRLAIGALKMARGKGLRVPEDLSIIGCGNLEMTLTTEVQLSTIKVDAERVGRLALKTLIEQIQDKSHKPKRIVLPVKLIIRESSKMLSGRDN